MFTVYTSVEFEQPITETFRCFYLSRTYHACCVVISNDGFGLGTSGRGSDFQDIEYFSVLLVQLCLKSFPVRKYGLGKFRQFLYMKDAGFLHALNVLAGFKLQCTHRTFPRVAQPVERSNFFFC